MTAQRKRLHCLVVGGLRLPQEFVGGHQSASVSVTSAATAAQAESRLGGARPDLIVTDIEGQDGAWRATLKRWIAICPVIVMSAGATLAQRVLALEMGAEDFITLPAADREIALRIERALGRWSRMRRGMDNVIRFSDFALDPGARVLRREGRGEVALSASEGSLLELLLTKPDRPASRQEIARRCLKSAFNERSRAPDMLASKLRAKLRQLGEAEALETLRGEGYRLRVNRKSAGDLRRPRDLATASGFLPRAET